MPRGPASSTTVLVGASTAAGRAVVPVSSVLQVSPASVVRNRPPAVSSAKPVVAVGKATSRTSSEVDTLPRLHVRPASVVRASVPLAPGANAVPCCRPATIRENAPLRRPPTAVKFIPASSDSAVEPSSPPATIRVGEAKAAAWIGSGLGVTSVALSPPSFVRTSCPPPSVVITHSAGDAQRIEVSAAPEPARPRAAQVAPPSLVRRTSEPSPTA